jgi:hypothetical protein
MALANTLTPFISLACLATLGTRPPVVVPLGLACLAIVVAIPFAAARAKLHIPGYVGLAFLACAVGLLFGRISGARAVTGTIAGLILSILFFLLMATAVGSVLALFFFRHPPEA